MNEKNEDTTEEGAAEEEGTAAISKKPELNTTRGWNPKNKHFDHESNPELGSAPVKKKVNKQDRKKKTSMAKKSRRTNRKK